MAKTTHFKRNKELFRAFKAIRKEKDRIFNKELPKLEYDLNNICLHTISEWYAGYEPMYYRRNMSLKKAFKITVNSEKIKVDYNSDYLSDFQHHQDNEIIFNNAFILGYHGGSTGKDVPEPYPYWRTPFLYYTKWGALAAPDFSPYEKMDKECQIRMDTEISKWEKRLLKHIEAIESRLASG